MRLIGPLFCAGWLIQSRLFDLEAHVAHPADRSFHDDVQQELWDAVNAVDARRSKELSKQIPVMRSIVPNTGEAPTAESGASRCVGESTMVKVCTE